MSDISCYSLCASVELLCVNSYFWLRISACPQTPSKHDSFTIMVQILPAGMEDGHAPLTAMPSESCWSVVRSSGVSLPCPVTSPSLVFPSGGISMSFFGTFSIFFFTIKLKYFLEERDCVSAFQLTLPPLPNPNFAVSDKIPFKFVACGFNTSLGPILERVPFSFSFCLVFSFNSWQRVVCQPFFSFCFSQNSLLWVARTTFWNF